VSSPGGSDTASEEIGAAMHAARAAGKPVVVSMGTYAASGGYWISAGASSIVAEPSTLTGSIGVFGGKFVIKGLLDKLGVSFDSMQFGSNAGIWSPVVPFTPAGRAKLDASLDAVYRDFTDKVATARNIDPARIPSVAKGRVFTGEQALKLGLVDALGGLPTALRLAREAAGLAPGTPIRLQDFPREGTGIERLLGRVLTREVSVGLRADAPLQRLASSLGIAVPSLRSLLIQLPALAAPGEAWLLMPPLDVR
jgi:protease-4